MRRANSSPAPGTPATAPRAVERAVPFAFLIQSLMIIWYALAGDPAAGVGRRRTRCPWYKTKVTPAPADMHAALRSELTDARICGIGPGQDGSRKSSTAL